MLKEFISLYAEKFLKHKNKYISERSVAIDVNNVVRYDLDQYNKWFEFYPPFDGLVSVTGVSRITKGIDVFTIDNSLETLRQCINGYNSEFCATYTQCREGKLLRVAIYCDPEKTEPNQHAGNVRFYPFSN